MASRIESSPILARTQSAEPAPLTTGQIQQMISAVTAEQINSMAKKLAENARKTVGYYLTVEEVMKAFIFPPGGGVDLLRWAWKDHDFESYGSRRKPISPCKGGLYYIINSDLSDLFSTPWAFFFPGFWFTLSDQNALKDTKFSTPYPVKYQLRLEINNELTQSQQLVFTLVETIDNIEIHRENFSIKEIENLPYQQ